MCVLRAFVLNDDPSPTTTAVFQSQEDLMASHPLQDIPFLILNFHFFLTHCRVFPVWV